MHRFGSLGTHDGQFQFPSGVAVSPRGDIAVADTMNNRVQVRERKLMNSFIFYRDLFIPELMLFTKTKRKVHDDGRNNKTDTN